MLFKRFILVTALIAMSGIGLLQVIAYTTPNYSDFEVGQRLKEWKVHEARKACESNPRVCFGVTADKAANATS